MGDFEIDNKMLVIPKDWDYVPISEVILATKQRDPGKNPEDEIKYVDVSGVSNELFKVKEFSILKGKDAPSRARKIIETDDVIFATVRPTLKRVAIIEFNLNNQLCSTGYCVLKANKSLIDFRFLYFFLLTDFYINQIQKYQSGASYPAVSDSTVKKIKIPKPPLPEQHDISHILSLIQSAIQKQVQIINTTSELKNTLMKKLFTEGMNNEPLKESEIGFIPESWEAVKIGDLFKFSSGKSKPKDTVSKRDDEHSYPVYGGNGVLGYSSQSLFTNSKLILGRVGEYCGCSHLTEDTCWISDNALYAKEILKELSLEYYCEFFEYFDLNRFSNKSGQPLITQGIINNILISYPTLESQLLIANSLSALTTKIYFHKRKHDALRDLFQSSLHELMTGKIRINNISETQTVLETVTIQTEKIPS